MYVNFSFFTFTNSLDKYVVLDTRTLVYIFYSDTKVQHQIVGLKIFQ